MPGLPKEEGAMSKPTISFVVPGDPVSSNELYGHGRGRVYKTPQAKAYQEAVAAAGIRARREANLSTFIGPVEVTLGFVFSSARPDNDGPSKPAIDALQFPSLKPSRAGASIVRNDRQARGRIVILPARVDPENPRTEVTVTALDEERALKEERRDMRTMLSPKKRAGLVTRKLQPSTRNYR